MPSFNKVQVVGHLGSDPQSRGEGKFAAFSVATSKKGDKANEKKPTWFNFLASGKTAEYVMKYLKKGSLVMAEGELELKEHNGKAQLSVFAHHVAGLGGGKTKDAAAQEPQAEEAGAVPF